MATAPRLAVGVFKEQARGPGVRKWPSGIGMLPILAFPLFRTIPLTLHAPSHSRLPGELNSPAHPRLWANLASSGGKRDPGPRAGGRDGTRCSVVLFPANIALVPASGPPGPPAPLLTTSRAAPAVLTFDPRGFKIDWSVAAAIVSKWDLGGL